MVTDFLRPTRPEEGTLIALSWADIVQHENWNEADLEELGDLDAVTWGVLVADNPHFYAIAGTYNYTDETWADVHVFPKRPPEIRRASETVREVL